MKKRHLLMFCFVLLMLCSCTDEFDYSVYSQHVDKKRQNTTQKNIERLDAQNTKEFSDFSVFLISDTHLYYNRLRQAKDKINSLTDKADFVIHCGDISNEGLTKEYEFAWDLMNEIHLPYLTVIGNHDLVANGRSIYQKMFGSENYSYVYKNCKFVFFDDNVWENTVTDPDFFWLKEQLTDTLGQYTHVFLISHVPHTDEMFLPTQKYAYKTIIEQSGVQLCIHGHLRSPDIITDALDDMRKITYLITGSIKSRSFRSFDITKYTFFINDITF